MSSIGKSHYKLGQIISSEISTTKNEQKTNEEKIPENLVNIDKLAQDYIDKYDKNKDSKIKLSPDSNKSVLSQFFTGDGSEFKRNENSYNFSENYTETTVYIAENLFKKSDQYGNKDGVTDKKEVMHFIKMFDDNNDGCLEKESILESINIFNKSSKDKEFNKFNTNFGEKKESIFD